MGLNENFVNELFYGFFHNPEFFRKVSSKISIDFFPAPEEKKLFQILQKSGNKVPTIGVAIQNAKLANEDEQFLRMLKRIKKVKRFDQDSLLGGLESFIKNGMMVVASEKIQKSFNRGDKQKSYDLILELAEGLNSVGFDRHNFIEVLGDMTKGFKDKIRGEISNKKISWGIPELDDITFGIDSTEIALLTALSGKGKSFFILWVALHNMLRGMKVLHVQLEGTETQLMDRYYSAVSGIDYYKIKRNDIAIKDFLKVSSVLKKKKNSMFSSEGEIYVWARKGFRQSVTTNDVYEMYKALEKKGINIDLIVIDYYDLLEPYSSKKFGVSDERFRQKEIGIQLKNINIELEIPIIIPTQASDINSIYENDEDFVLSKTNLSEFKGKTRPFDQHITMNISRKESRERSCRLYVDKSRETKSGDIVKIATNLKRSRFYDHNRTMELFYMWENRDEEEI